MTLELLQLAHKIGSKRKKNGILYVDSCTIWHMREVLSLQHFGKSILVFY